MHSIYGIKKKTNTNSLLCVIDFSAINRAIQDYEFEKVIFQRLSPSHRKILMISHHYAHLRHAQYYATLLLNADQLYQDGDINVEKGLRLFDDNWRNIEIGQQWASLQSDIDEEAATLALEFPERGAHCLYLRQKPTERLLWLEKALYIAHAREFGLVEGALLGKIGLALVEIGEYQKAIEYYSTRLELAERLNDLDGLGEGACNLGILYDSMNLLEPAQECFQYALGLAKKTSNQKITELASGNLGLVYLKLGKFSEAANCFELHLRLAKASGDRWSEGNALTNVGIAYLKQQEYSQAIKCFETSIEINRELGDNEGKAKNLGYIGSVLSMAGDLDRAILAYQERIVLAKKLNDPHGEAIGSWNLGEVLIKQKKYQLGLELLYKCIDYEKSIGDPSWEDDLKMVREVEKKFRGLESNVSE